MSDRLKYSIQVLFEVMNEEVDKIVNTSSSASQATKAILDYVPEKIASAAEGYMIDLYKVLSKETLEEPIFQTAANANRFYELQLRQKITSAYRFDVKDLQEYIEGKDFEAISNLYTTAAVGVGGAVVSGILLGALSGVVHIPIVGIIAGAFLVGLGCAGIYASGSKRKKSEYRAAVKTFMADLESEMVIWVDKVVEFYNSVVEGLKATL